MPLIKAIDLPRNRISIRCGYDGFEPVDILRKGRGLSSVETRIAILIHQEYTDVLCDCYLNRALIGIVQDALSRVGLSVVLKEVYDPAALVPEEERCALCENEEYLLVSRDMRVKGSLELWNFSWSWGGEFYDENNLVMDAIIRTDLFSPFESCLENLCCDYKIEFRNFGQAERTSKPFLKGPIIKFLSRICPYRK